MAITTVGLQSPGDMGHSIGGVLHEHGLRVVTCLEGRSERSRTLAAKAGIEDGGSLEDIVREVDIFLSVLVPSSAREFAGKVAAAMQATGASPPTGRPSSPRPSLQRRPTSAGSKPRWPARPDRRRRRTPATSRWATPSPRRRSCR